MRAPLEVALELLEKVGTVERESNQKLSRTDGPHYGPDPDVQREIKNHGYLARVAKRKTDKEARHIQEIALELSEIPDEELDESRLAQVAGFAAKIAGGHEHGEVARHAAEYVVNRGEHFVRSKLAKMKAARGAGRLRRVTESLPEYSGTPASKTGSQQVAGYKNNPNRIKPKSGGRGDGFYRDGSEENSARIKMTDGSAM